MGESPCTGWVIAGLEPSALPDTLLDGARWGPVAIMGGAEGEGGAARDRAHVCAPATSRRHGPASGRACASPEPANRDKSPT